MRNLAIALFAALAAPAASAAQPWLKAQSRDVCVYSDASNHDTVEFAVRYAEFRQVLDKIFAPPGRHAPPATILLFRKADTLQGYLSNAASQAKAAHGNLLNYSVAVDAGRLFCLALSGDREAALRYTFEGDAPATLHHMGYFIPLWMAQGTGEVFASLKFRKSTVVIGEPEDRFDDPLQRYTWLPWPRFVVTTTGSPEYLGTARGGNASDPTGIYQAQAWLLMHTILLEGGDMRTRFRTLAPLVHSNSEDLGVIAAYLHTTPEQLSSVLRKHDSRSRRLELPLDEAAVRASLVVSPAPEAEIRVQLAELLVGDRQQLQSEVQLDRAVALAPRSALVREALARQSHRQHNDDDMVQHYREAIEAGSTNPRAYFYSAAARINDGQQHGRDFAGKGGPEVATAIAELHKALQLDPGDGIIYGQLARAYYVSPDTTREQLAELEPALADPDLGMRIRLSRALTFIALGDKARGLADLHSVAADSRANDSERGQALEQLQRVTSEGDKDQVMALARAGKFDAALALIDAKVASGDETIHAPSYGNLRTWVVRNQQQAAPSRRDDATPPPAAGLPVAQTQNGRMRVVNAAGQDVPPPPRLDFLITHQAWSYHRQYLQTFADKVQGNWTEKASVAAKDFHGKIGLTFTLHRDGTLSDFNRVQAPPNTPAAVVDLCRRAIATGAPYEAWDDAMGVQFGETQRLLLRFTFD